MYEETLAFDAVMRQAYRSCHVLVVLGRGRGGSAKKDDLHQLSQWVICSM